MLIEKDKLTNLVEAFPCGTEKAQEMVKLLVSEIIPRCGHAKNLQSDNSSTFKVML